MYQILDSPRMLLSDDVVPDKGAMDALESSPRDAHKFGV